MALNTEDMRAQIMAMNTTERGMNHRHTGGNGNGYRRRGNGNRGNIYSSNRNYQQDTITIPTTHRAPNSHGNDLRKMQNNKLRGGYLGNRGRGRPHKQRQNHPKATQSAAQKW